MYTKYGGSTRNRMDSSLNIKAFAKINLGLDVIGKRKDGYHEIRTIMQSVGVFDTLCLKREKGSGIRLFCDQPSVPSDRTNLAYRAAELMFRKYGIEGGMEIRLHKRIPAAAGLGGGSSDAAAVMTGIRELYGLKCSFSDLEEAAVLIGADVPYCIRGGTVLAEGIGEKMTRLPDMPDCTVVIVKPEANISTKLIFENLGIEKLDARSHPDMEKVIRSIYGKDVAGVAENMGNILETVTLKLCPEIGTIKAAMIDAGAAGALMSGSGSAVFGIFTDGDNAEKCAASFRAGCGSGLLKQVFTAKMVRAREEER